MRRCHDTAMKMSCNEITIAKFQHRTMREHGSEKFCSGALAPPGPHPNRQAVRSLPGSVNNPG